MLTWILLTEAGVAPTTSSRCTSRASELGPEMLGCCSICPPFLLRYNYWTGAHPGPCSGIILYKPLTVAIEWSLLSFQRSLLFLGDVKIMGGLLQVLAVAFQWIPLWFWARDVRHCRFWKHDILHCYDREHQWRRARDTRITQAVKISENHIVGEKYKWSKRMLNCEQIRVTKKKGSATYAFHFFRLYLIIVEMPWYNMCNQTILKWLTSGL